MGDVAKLRGVKVTLAEPDQVLPDCVHDAVASWEAVPSALADVGTQKQSVAPLSPRVCCRHACQRTPIVGDGL